MKLLILICSFTQLVFANKDISELQLQHLLEPAREVKTNDLTALLLNPIDILKLTHKETTVHPESKILGDKEELDYIFQWNGNGTVEVYTGKYPKESYWFTTKIFRSASKKVVRIEEMVRDGVDSEGRKKIIASISNFSGYELQDQTRCQGYIEKTLPDPKFKRFLASEQQEKSIPQVILQCNTVSENMCQQYERITKLNDRFDKNGHKYWEKFFNTSDHKQWISEIADSHQYQTQQRDNFIDLKLDLKPGGKYASIYWPEKLTHHRYQGHRKGESISDEKYEGLKTQCAELKAYIAPAPEYIRDKAMPKKQNGNGAGVLADGVAKN